MKEHKTLLKLLQKAYDNVEANQNGRQIDNDYTDDIVETVKTELEK